MTLPASAVKIIWRIKDLSASFQPSQIKASS
jgi:hypothetical protein